MSGHGLPEGWRSEPLGRLANFVNGAAFKPDDWHGEGTPIIRIQNLTDPDREPNLTRRVVAEKYEIRAGDLLVSWSATLDVFQWSGPKAWLNQHIFKVSDIRADVDQRYFRHLLKNEIQTLQNGADFRGATMSHINRGPFLAHVVPVPPLAVQQRIAGLLDAAMAEVGIARSAVDQALKSAGRLRAAAFAEAATEGDWPVVPLIELCQGKGKYGLSVKAHPEPIGYPMLRMGNIQDGRLDIADLTYVELSDEEYDEYRVRAGDIIFNRTNSAELVGKTAYVEEDTEAVFASYLVRFRANRKKAEPRFLAQVINSPIGRAYIEQHMGRAIGQVNISAGKMHEFPVPAPPLATQREIMERVDRVSAIAQAALQDLRSQSETLDAFPVSLLSAAFRGEL